MAKDKFEILNERLKEIVEKFDALKKQGLDVEVLIPYLQKKTHLSEKKIKEILHHTEEFYDKLVKNAILENLKD